MARKISSLVLLAVLFFSMTACSAAKQIDLTAANNGSRVDINVGGLIVISLEGNPSTGYTWETSNLDSTILKQVGDAAFISSDPSLMGSGGTLALTFEALKAGTTTLTLVYHRPWETDVDPIDTFTVTVVSK